MSYSVVPSSSCSPRCEVPSVRNPATAGMGEGTTWECPRCGATWRLDAVGSMRPRVREHRWTEIEQGMPALQRMYDQDSTWRAGWTVFAVFAGIGVIVAVGVTLALTR